MPPVVVITPGIPNIPPLHPASARPAVPRNVADIRLRLVIRLHRNIQPAFGFATRRGRTDLDAIKQQLVDVAQGAYSLMFPSRLDKTSLGWGFLLEPAFPGAPTKGPHRLWSYFILSFPAVRGDDLGPMWNLAYELVRNVSEVELAYPESFGDKYKLSSAGASAVAPGDMAWSLRQMKVPEARMFAGSQGRPAGGENVVVGHLDTGWSRHPQLEAGSVDQARQKNMLSVAVFPPRIEASNDAVDPYTGPADIFHAHGLATASVLASRGQIFAPDPQSLAPGAPLKSGTGNASGPQTFFTGAGPNQLVPNAEVVGVAPGATILPIRCTDSVMLTGDIEIAQGVWYACEQNVDVITMSLGGVPSPLLHVALAHAVTTRNIVFCAAAGNLTPFVVFPAAYPEAIACAGSRPDGKPWRAVYGSSFGPQVDISAPAQGVWIADMIRANNTETPIVKPGEGTSFAAPAVAGAVAVWLAFHGRAALLARYPGIPLQDVFRTLLKRTAADLSGARSGWPRDFGAGVIDLDQLLRTPLPAPDDVERMDPWGPDAFMGYLADGVAGVLAAAGASRLPPGAAGAMLLLELAQLMFSNSDFGKSVRDFANNVQRSADSVVDDIGRFIESAANAVSDFFKRLFS